MTRADIDEVMRLETTVYPFPWTRGNFIDSLAAGYWAEVLRQGRRGRLLGYVVAMAGAGELHLLNITVEPAAQRQGHARRLLTRLIAHGRELELERLWLEVRESNVGARAAYEHMGFAAVGVRPGYYPAPANQRESAVVMSLSIDAAQEPRDALG